MPVTREDKRRILEKRNQVKRLLRNSIGSRATFDSPESLLDALERGRLPGDLERTVDRMGEFELDLHIERLNGPGRRFVW